MICLVPVSLLSRQSLKSLNLKLPSHVNMPQNVPNENIMFGFIKSLSQVITRFDGVIASSSPNEKENAHSPNVPMFSPKSEVIYEKS